jgi:hypothetical protein
VFTDDNGSNHQQWFLKVKYFTYEVKNIFILNPQKTIKQPLPGGWTRFSKQSGDASQTG